MGVTRISFTPRGDSAVNVDFWAPRGVSRFQGGPSAAGVLNVSRGGLAYKVTWDSWHEYELELRGVRPAARSLFFERMWAWWSHALSGGSFSLAMDSDQATSAIVTNGAAQGATALVVPSTSGFGGGDWVYLEDGIDPSRFTRAQLRVVGSGTTLTLVNGLPFTLAAGSIVRHAEYFPKCVTLSDVPPFRERDGDRGVGLWDLRLSLRTVR